jgi:hypothetical protein
LGKPARTLQPARREAYLLVNVTVPCITVEWPGNEQKNT